MNRPSAARLRPTRFNCGSQPQGLHYNKEVKARVLVMMKNSVLDPQGQAVRRALNGLGHSSIGEVRQGKCFEIDFVEGTPRASAERELNLLAEDVLSNPVIEDYRIEFL